MTVDRNGEVLRSLGTRAMADVNAGVAQALLIGGKEPALGRELLDEALAAVEAALAELDAQVHNARPKAVHPGGREPGHAGAREEPTDIETFIIDLLGSYPEGLSVQLLLTTIDEAGFETPRRETLVVRLHRMAKAGKILNVSHGHYRLPDPAARQRAR